MITKLYRWWPRCKPYDSRRRICLSYPVWNGRCAKHVARASAIGEQP